LSLLKNKLGSKFDASDANLIANNLLRVEIFYKEFNYEEIEETPAYPVVAYTTAIPVVIQLYFIYILNTSLDF